MTIGLPTPTMSSTYRRLFILISGPYLAYHLSQILFALSVSTLHNIGPIIVPSFIILCNIISFVYPTGVSIVTIALLFVFLIKSTSSGNPILFSSLQAAFNHNFSASASRMYVSLLLFLLSSIIACSVNELS